MSDVTINYKGSAIATMDDSGTKTLLTEGKYCEDDIEVVYVSPGGGGTAEAPDNDVVFWDYDGTKVYSYTKQEFLALDAMPANPSHTGLTAQGWNWTLQDAKEFVTLYGECDIGQSYTTTDGKTRAFITIPYPGETTFKVLWTQDKENGVEIDWGDGSTAETFSGTGNKNATHTYAEPGDYTITFAPDNDCIFGLSNTSGGPFTGGGNTEYWGATCVKGVFIGNNYPVINVRSFSGSYSLIRFVSIPETVTTISENAFESNCAIKYLTIPKNCTTIATNFVSSCRNLRRISLPRKTITLTGNASNTFYQCSVLERLVFPDKNAALFPGLLNSSNAIQHFIIPNDVTTISASAFSNCYAIRYLTIPENVISIGGQAFNVMRALLELHLLPTTPPTVDNSNAFSNMGGNVYVPYSADHSILDAYKTATNWSSIASKIYEETP